MSLLSKDDNQILIIGCGRLGASIANELSNRNKDVTIIDISKDNFRKLSRSFEGLSLEGNGTDFEVLKEAQIQSSDVVLAVTDNDNVNIMVAQIARLVFGIEKVIARLYDPEKQCVYKDLGVKTILPSLLSVEQVDRILHVTSLGAK